jgi:hypothetical protein
MPISFLLLMYSVIGRRFVAVDGKSWPAGGLRHPPAARIQRPIFASRQYDGTTYRERSLHAAWKHDPAGVLFCSARLCVPNIRFSMDAENRRGKFAT